MYVTGINIILFLKTSKRFWFCCNKSNGSIASKCFLMFLLQNILENAIPIKAVIMFENSLIRNQCLATPWWRRWWRWWWWSTRNCKTVSNVDCAGIILSAGWICLWQVWGGDNGVADSEESAVQGHHRPELKNVFWQMWDPHCGYAPPVRTHHGWPVWQCCSADWMILDKRSRVTYL